MSKQLNNEMKVKLGEVITCECCSKQIVKEHPYQIYCAECSHKVMREKNTLAVRRFRDKKKKEIEQLEQQMAQQQDATADTTDTTDRSDS